MEINIVLKHSIKRALCGLLDTLEEKHYRAGLANEAVVELSMDDAHSGIAALRTVLDTDAFNYF